MLAAPVNSLAGSLVCRSALAGRRADASWPDLGARGRAITDTGSSR
jgi:hypothetical protein